MSKLIAAYNLVRSARIVEFPVGGGGGGGGSISLPSPPLVQIISGIPRMSLTDILEMRRSRFLSVDALLMFFMSVSV